MVETLLTNHLIPIQKKGSSDIFQTPPEAISILLRYVEPELVVWESACGFGMIVEFLLSRDYKVIATDIETGFDFFEYKPEQHWDIQITNPPYSIKDDWLKRSFELGKPFALLLPVNALHSIKRCDMFREYGIQLIIPPKRINFVTPSGKGKGAWFPVMWFCYGLNLEHDLNFPEVFVLSDSKQLGLI